MTKNEEIIGLFNQYVMPTYGRSLVFVKAVKCGMLTGRNTWIS